MKQFFTYLLIGLFIPSISLAFSGGSGTEGDPWQIATVADLVEVKDYLGSLHTNKYFQLTAHIDLDTAPYNTGSGWDPIGDLSNRFYGQFDGNGYTISNLFISTTTDYVGLFGFTNSATIEDLTVSNIQVTGRRYLGGLVGYANDTALTQINISGIVTSTGRESGGLVGWHNSGAISFVTTSVHITHTGTDSYTGGVVGYMGAGSMLHVAATGTVTGHQYVGGVAGIFSSSVTTVSSTYATGDVTARSGQAGGLAGQFASVDIYNSYATGNVSSTGNYAGGLYGFGQGSFTITRSYASGNITGTSACGGLGGYTESFGSTITITDSYARGNVSCSGASTGISPYVRNVTFNQVYYAGELPASGANRGGLAATGGVSYTVNNSFWDVELSGLATTLSSKGTGTSTAAMKTQSTFTDAGWDFDSGWAMDSEINDGYAYLAWQVNDTTPPTVSTLSPADNATSIAIDSSLVITFDEDMVTGTGYIYLKLSSDNTIIEQFNVASSTVTASGTTALVLNPTSNLEYETAYYVTIDATAVDDTNGNSFAGIADSSTWNFVTIVAPPTSVQYTTPHTYTVATVISSLSPVVVGGTPTSFSVLPALPTGLLLDPFTGIISGTPITETALATYTVTASNISGTTTFDIQITIATDAIEEEPEESSGGGRAIIVIPPTAFEYEGKVTVNGINGLNPLFVPPAALKSNADPNIVNRMAISFDDPTFTGVSVIPYAELQTLTMPPSATTLYVRYFSTTGHQSQDFPVNLNIATVDPAEPTDVTEPTLACSIDFSAINTPIRAGANNNEAHVRLLEQFLNTYEQETLTIDGIYGTEDVSAVVRWQEKYANDVLAPWGITAGTGYVFTTSLAKIQDIHAAHCTTLTSNQKTIPSEPASPSISLNLTRSLERGMSGDDVQHLQQALNRLGFTIAETGTGSPGNESTYFGTRTYDAVIRFQSAYRTDILAPLGLDSPTGFFGPSSIAHIQRIIN